MFFAARGPDHFLRGALADAFGISIAPDAPGGVDGLVARIGLIADKLSGEVIGDRVDLEAILLGNLDARASVGRIFGCPLHIEMVSPAGDLDALVAEFFRFLAHLLKIQIGPLAGKNGDRTAHNGILLLLCL